MAAAVRDIFGDIVAGHSDRDKDEEEEAEEEAGSPAEEAAVQQETHGAPWQPCPTQEEGARLTTGPTDASTRSSPP